MTWGLTYFDEFSCSGNGYHRYIRHTYRYELAFTAMRSVSGQSCEVKQRRARLVAGWMTQALEQGRRGSCAHAGYHQYNIVKCYVWNCSI